MQRLGPSFRLYLSAEDPSSNDVYADDPDPNLFNTETPDGVIGIEYRHEDRGHLRLNSIVRQVEVTIPGVGEDSEVGWGLALTGSVRVYKQDYFRFSGVYGEGLGRYLLGLQSTAGASINAADNELSLNENWGVMAAYGHHWRPGLRSSVYAGYAKADRSGSDPANAFESTVYASANLMWSPLAFFTIGVEYGYGRRENRDGSDLDNHRVGLGFQIF